jgi:hypothetical protein
MGESSQLTGQSTLYIHPEAHETLTASALILYARSQVMLSETADKNVVDKDQCIVKALTAATKAYSLHSLPIYMLDIASLFEMLRDTASAQEAFRSFLELQKAFQPSDVDRIALRERDVEKAIRQAESPLQAVAATPSALRLVCVRTSS